MFNTAKDRAIYERSKLGAAIFNLNISVARVAKIVGLSRQTIYKWMETDDKSNLSFGNAMKRDALLFALEQTSGRSEKDMENLIQRAYEMILRELADSSLLPNKDRVGTTAE